MNLLITGAAGHVATLTLPGLAGRHALHLADLRAPTTLPVGASFHGIDLLQASDAEFSALFAGVEVVLHSAYVSSGQADVYSAEPLQIAVSRLNSPTSGWPRVYTARRWRPVFAAW